MAWLLNMETENAHEIKQGKIKRAADAPRKSLAPKVAAKNPASEDIKEEIKARAKAATVSAMAKRYRELNTLVPSIATAEGVRMSLPIAAVRKLDSFFQAANIKKVPKAQ